MALKAGGATAGGQVGPSDALQLRCLSIAPLVVAIMVIDGFWMSTVYFVSICLAEFLLMAIWSDMGPRARAQLFLGTLPKIRL